MKRTWFLLVLLAAALPAAAATDMYAWTDASGVKHFSDSPPPSSVKARKLKVNGGITTSAAEEVQKEQAAKSAGPELAAAAGYAPEDIKRNCDIARRNLATIQAQKPAVDADGYPVDLEAVKSQQMRIDKANQQITLFCPK
ncbi:MAG: DUF4124 domain-containing protein [Dokdonella sp.]